MIVKVILGILLVLIVLVAAIYFYGTSLPHEKSHSRVVLINAAPETLYDIAINAEAQSSWRKDVSKITMRPDQKSWIEHTNQGDIFFTILEENRPNSFSLEFKGQGFEGTWKGEFVASGNGTEVSLVENISIQNPFFRSLSNLMKFTEKFMDRYIHDLEIEAERR
ncbi:MAG: SRPBCC family protein [Hyphomicrobiaceae bacterium]|nr:SRPBCC family protein [Hyphomicrobiaceae bacterium]